MDSEYVFELLRFPDKILDGVFANFNEIDLLNAARVCKRFEAIAKETFASKYNGDSKDKYYDIKVYADDTIYDQKMYRTFLQTFGNEISALNFTSERRPNQYNMVKLISKHCQSIKYINIRTTKNYELNILQLIQSMTKLTSLTLKGVKNTNFFWTGIHFPYLTTFAMDDVHDMDVQVLKQFLYVNPQLEHLRIINCPKFPLRVIQALRDKMKRLKSLEYNTNKNSFGDKCRDINMERLETLKISVDTTSFRTVLGAIASGSKMIQSLEILRRENEASFTASVDDGYEPEEIHHEMDEVIPRFEKLTSLRLVNFRLSVSLTRHLIHLLPLLVSLKVDVQLDEFHSSDILFIFKKCKHLKELVLESYWRKIKTEEFNLEFHREFTEITQNRGDGVKFEVIEWKNKMTITADKIIKNGELFYWNKYEALNSRSEMHLLDLSDECLSHIYFYLDEQGERGLYETCTRTKQAMHDRIAKQVFTVTGLDSARDTFKRFGEHITKLAIDLNANNDAQTAAAWSFIGTKFADKITELSLVSVRVSAVESLRIRCPNVTTLKIMSVVTSQTHILPPMDCPKLTHIEFQKYNIILAKKASKFGVSLDRLTTIKLSAMSKSIMNILHSLDDGICDQIQELFIDKYTDTLCGKYIMTDNIHFVNIAMRFKNLTTLHFGLHGIENTNIKYLFATCTKLVKLTMNYRHVDTNKWLQIIRHIKENCKHLQVIQLTSSFDDFDEKFMDELVNALPQVQIKIFLYDHHHDTYKAGPYTRITKSDRIKPF